MEELQERVTRMLETLTFEQLELVTHGLREGSAQLLDGRDRAGAHHHVEGLAVGPRELVTDE